MRWLFILALAATARADVPQTEQQYLSGHGPADAVSWEFECTGGRRSGTWTTIPVPSNWELQGFGTYNYGQEPTPKADEHGHYRLHFKAPDRWRGRRIRLVFEGVMTDATVRVNGQLAGPVHQGGFYRFRYDITSLASWTKDNLLEVDVAKVSSNPNTEKGERFADYWVFGGIYRPVYLEAVPAESIEETAIVAGADGRISADITLGFPQDHGRIEAQVLDSTGNPVGRPFGADVPGGGTGRVWLAGQIDHPALWNAETPNLYRLRLTLSRGAQVLHQVSERFGFRTFEVRDGQGLFLNGRRILLKGVDRHSFRPETGRSLNREDCYEDARTIKSMNMNAVRMSHYPPDVAFLEACDELGLYVLDELTGWHHANDTPTGQVLVREMVTRDVNHPSILFWDNGNEGGNNRELDGEFALHDPQHRTVLHPWDIFNGVDTKHYPAYADLRRRLAGPNVVMPTEFLHAIYDGGAGAGLEDYWNLLSHSREGGGGFIWMFADEGVVRTDQGGRIDVFSSYDPDGILGPHHEKEGSYFTIRDLYSPIQIDRPRLEAGFDGQLHVHNRYAFTGLDQCRFSWRLIDFAGPAAVATASHARAEGGVAGPQIAAGGDGVLALDLPPNWSDADAVEVTGYGVDRLAVWTWTWTTAAFDFRHQRLLAPAAGPGVRTEKTDFEISLGAGGVLARFDAKTGLLREIRRGETAFTLGNGPRLVFDRPETGEPRWLPWAGSGDAQGVWRLTEPHVANAIEVELAYSPEDAFAGFSLELSPDGQRWHTIYDSTRRSRDGGRYNFPPQRVAAIRLSRVRRSSGKRIGIDAVRIGYAADRFPDEAGGAGSISTGEDAGGAWIENSGGGGFERFRWTMRPNGSLQLDYRYTLKGPFEYFGVTFDGDEGKIRTLRWQGAGPYRVWQNRLRGTTFGVHQIAQHDLQPGESWDYPEFQGYFADWRWVRLATDAGFIQIDDLKPGDYFRIGTPKISHPNTTVDFPQGELSFLHAIPAMGSKSRTVKDSGPASQPAQATGSYEGTLLFRFGEADPEPLDRGGPPRK